MRERVEDLGRIYEKLVNILDSQLLQQSMSPIHPAIDLDFHEDLWHYVRMHIQLIKEDLYDCLEIASGQDALNLQD